MVAKLAFGSRTCLLGSLIVCVLGCFVCVHVWLFVWSGGPSLRLVAELVFGNRACLWLCLVGCVCVVSVFVLFWIKQLGFTEMNFGGAMDSEGVVSEEEAALQQALTSPLVSEEGASDSWVDPMSEEEALRSSRQQALRQALQQALTSPLVSEEEAALQQALQHGLEQAVQQLKAAGVVSETSSPRISCFHVFTYPDINPTSRIFSGICSDTAGTWRARSGRNRKSISCSCISCFHVFHVSDINPTSRIPFHVKQNCQNTSFEHIFQC